MRKIATAVSARKYFVKAVPVLYVICSGLQAMADAMSLPISTKLLALVDL